MKTNMLIGIGSNDKYALNRTLDYFNAYDCKWKLVY
jgi:hypothetical protein